MSCVGVNSSNTLGGGAITASNAAFHPNSL